MTKQKLLELIKQIISEYTGTGASGGNAGDGNNITAPGIPHDDEEAIERIGARFSILDEMAEAVEILQRIEQKLDAAIERMK